MIRIRPENFYCSQNEFLTLKSQIENFKSAGAHGFVFGILTRQNALDESKNSELIQLANPLPCTLHRAFDETSGLFHSLERAISCGFKRILTAGGKGRAIENVAAIKKLVELSQEQ